MFRRALSLFLMVGMIAGLTSSPAQAVSDRNVNCSVSGYIKIRSNEVVKKANGEGGAGINCVGTVVIPEGVTRLGDYSMDSEVGMTSIVIPDTVTAIGANSLLGTGLSRIIIPSSVTSISSGAFAYNLNLTSLVIPASVTSISYFIGIGNSKLNKIYFLGKVAPTIHSQTFVGMGNDTTNRGTGSGVIAYVPDGARGYPADGQLWNGVTVSGSGAIIVYESNGADSGLVPDDTNLYAVGDSVAALGNTGTLIRANHTFDGWTLEKDGSGTVLQPGDTFAAQAGATLLYANWVGDPKVKYSGNGNTSGTAPVDPNSPYTKNSSTTVLGNSGSLLKTGNTFDGWNTKADGTGTSYASSSTLPILTSNITLFARWIPETHTVSYDGNGSTGGTVPVDSASPHDYNTSVTVLGSGTLVRTGYDFGGWNTLANGLGTDRAANSNFTITSTDVVLYAKWTVKTTASVTYSGNGNTGGMVPVDGGSPYVLGASITVSTNSGSLAKTGYKFAGWNTAANGSGTNYSSTGSTTFVLPTTDVTLFAVWELVPVEVKPEVKQAPTTPTAAKPTASAPMFMPKFDRSDTTLTDKGKAAIKKIVKSSGVSANYLVTGVAGKLPGVSKADVEALAKARAERLKAYFVKLGVKESNIVIKIKITEIGVKPKTKIISQLSVS